MKIVFYTLGLLSVLFVSECFGQTKTENHAILLDEKITYEIPMAYELMHIAIALTDTTIVSNGYNVYNEIVNKKNSDYYQEVMNYFAPFKKHPLIIELNKSLRESASNYIYNVQIGGILSLENNKLDKVKTMPWIRRAFINLKAVTKKNIQNFAEISKFEDFYNKHKKYYFDQLKDVHLNANVQEQQNWLEKEFPTRYDKYRIIVSPLSGSTHFTQRFKFKRKRQCIMWVSTFNGDYQEKNSINKARYLGTVMTEIDHNYVNPVSDKYKKILNAIINDTHRTKWTNGGPSNSYKTGYKVFNEYMTHAVYLLFATQDLNDLEKQLVEKSRIDLMTRLRKFTKFAKFYEHVKLLYRYKKPNETITDIYPKVIEWCKTENKNGI